MAKIRVDKLEAAQRQIDAAIRMLFGNEDPVAIHTVAMAGFRILRDLAATCNDNYMRNTVQSKIKPGMEGKFWGGMQSFAGFLKHADRDPDATSENVEEEVNDTVLLMACLYYQSLGNKLTPEMTALLAYCLCLHPNYLRSDGFIDVQPILDFARASAPAKWPRQEQLVFGKELLSLARTLPTL